MDAGDQLEGESFQPAYAPYVPPPQAYDGAYEPLEQRGIEAAVAAGAAGYNGVSFFTPHPSTYLLHTQRVLNDL